MDNSFNFFSHFTVFLFSTVAIIGLIYPPKEINHIIGFRTKRSSKNQESWDLAQKLMGKFFLILTSITALGYSLLGFINISDKIMIFLLSLPIVIMFVGIFVINSKLPK